MLLGLQSSPPNYQGSQERCLDGDARSNLPPTANWNPGVFLEPRGALKSPLGLSCAPLREAILLCEIVRFCCVAVGNCEQMGGCRGNEL